MTTAYLVSIFLLSTRYFAKLAPLWAFIPAQWRWVPPALIAAGGELARAIPGVDPLPDVPGLDVIVILALALAPGLHAPDQIPPKSGTSLPIVMLLALLVGGCTPERPRTAHDVFCSDASVVVIDESCKAGVQAAHAEDRDTVEDACSLLVDVQTRTCGT